MILGPFSDHGRIACVLEWTFMCFLSYLECDFSLQAMWWSCSVTCRCRCSLWRCCSVTWLKFVVLVTLLLLHPIGCLRTVLDVHGLSQSNMNGVDTPGFASHTLLWHFTGRFLCFAIKLQCFSSYRLLRVLSCASLVLLLSDMNAVVTLRFLHPMACSAHCTGRVIFSPQSNTNVVMTMGLAQTWMS